jgi:hypothetical protein
MPSISQKPALDIKLCNIIFYVVEVSDEKK